MEQRFERFHSWDPSRVRRGELLGSGKYGVVYALRNQADTVVKCQKVERQSSVKQAYREHVVAILQTMLVLQRINPHVVMHFGADLRAGEGVLDLRLYMERFSGSLAAEVPELVLETSEDWLSMLFQLLSAVVAMSTLTGVVHNDLYARNILLRAGTGGAETYGIYGRSYRVPLKTFYAISDYGICGSPILDSRFGAVPEVSVKTREGAQDFGSSLVKGHVLSFKDLPPYSRDAYLLLKLGAFGHASLPAAPTAVCDWCAKSLRLMDQRQESFQRPDALVGLFHDIFDSFEISDVQPTWNCSADRKNELLQAGMECMKRTPLTRSPSERRGVSEK